MIVLRFRGHGFGPIPFKVQRRRASRARSDAPLLGRLFDDRGNRMGPTYASKKGLRYRYYVSSATVQGRKDEAGSVPRVPATELETLVGEAIARIPHPVSGAEPDLRERIAQGVDRVMVGKGQVSIHLSAQAAALGHPDPIVLAWSPEPMRRKREIIGAPPDGAARPIRAEARSRLLHAIARARAWLDEIMTGAVPDTEAIAAREAISERAVRQTLSLAFLAPGIVEAAADGRLPRGFGLSRLTDLPLGWAEQRAKLGLAAHA